MKRAVFLLIATLLVPANLFADLDEQSTHYFFELQSRHPSVPEANDLLRNLRAKCETPAPTLPPSPDPGMVWGPVPIISTPANIPSGELYPDPSYGPPKKALRKGGRKRGKLKPAGAAPKPVASKPKIKRKPEKTEEEGSSKASVPEKTGE